MVTYFVSSSTLTYNQYRRLHKALSAFGWKATWTWPQSYFQESAYLDEQQLTRALAAIARTDIYIAILPASCSSCLEIGVAFTLCEEICLLSKDPVHFTQTGLDDAYISVLPKAKRLCCGFDEIPALIKQEYIHLIRTDRS